MTTKGPSSNACVVHAEAYVAMTKRSSILRTLPREAWSDICMLSDCDLGVIAPPSSSTIGHADAVLSSSASAQWCLRLLSLTCPAVHSDNKLYRCDRTLVGKLQLNHQPANSNGADIAVAWCFCRTARPWCTWPQLADKLTCEPTHRRKAIVDAQAHRSPELAGMDSHASFPSHSA